MHPAVLAAIREAALTGASAPSIADALSQRSDLPDGSIPSERTISNIARDTRPAQPSKPWSIADADPATVGLVLAALAEVVRRTEGRIGSFSQDEAALLPTIDRAIEPRWSKLPSEGARLWQAYAWTRFYLSWVRTEQDGLDVTLLIAAMQGNGKWPITRWSQIERVIKQAEGWMPPELVEVER